ncbi:MAG: glycosyltransferase [Leucobacter sp.]
MSLPSTPRRTDVSVCMASYCGAQFIDEQIRSILAQLSETDELVVVDDASTDDTAAAVRSIGDHRIRFFEQPENQGYVRTFERALAEARGDFVLLADQDDVWPDGRVAAMRTALERADVVAGNLDLLSADRPIPGPLGIREWRLPRIGRRAPLRNVLGIVCGIMPYFGCAMGFRRSFADRALPFPPWLYESHDLWLAVVGNLAGDLVHIPDTVTLRRLHDDNASPSQPRSLPQIARSRLLVLRMIREARLRRRANPASTSTPRKPIR